MTSGYPSDRFAGLMTPENGWRHDVIHDRHGNPMALVAVRVGPRWTDAVAIEGEDQCVATRHHTPHDTVPDVPSEIPSESTAVWHRDGRAEDVLAELLELPAP
ncbi:MAG: hypothetical protein GEV09_04825 [Pseudonocardiaceae bacterium]|nr:hypothetical protein [Pseudonocardiaceae bacterium]